MSTPCTARGADGAAQSLGRVITLEGLPPYYTPTDVRVLCHGFGTVEVTRMNLPRREGQAVFRAEAAARIAVSTLNGAVISGYPIRVTHAAALAKDAVAVAPSWPGCAVEMAETSASTVKRTSPVPSSSSSSSTVPDRGHVVDRLHNASWAKSIYQLPSALGGVASVAMNREDQNEGTTAVLPRPRSHTLSNESAAAAQASHVDPVPQPTSQVMVMMPTPNASGAPSVVMRTAENAYPFHGKEVRLLTMPTGQAQHWPSIVLVQNDELQNSVVTLPQGTPSDVLPTGSAPRFVYAVDAMGRTDQQCPAITAMRATERDEQQHSGPYSYAQVQLVNAPFIESHGPQEMVPAGEARRYWLVGVPEGSERQAPFVQSSPSQPAYSALYRALTNTPLNDTDGVNPADRQKVWEAGGLPETAMPFETRSQPPSRGLPSPPSTAPVGCPLPRSATAASQAFRVFPTTTTTGEEDGDRNRDAEDEEMTFSAELQELLAACSAAPAEEPSDAESSADAGHLLRSLLFPEDWVPPARSEPTEAIASSAVKSAATTTTTTTTATTVPAAVYSYPSLPPPLPMRQLPPLAPPPAARPLCGPTVGKKAMEVERGCYPGVLSAMEVLYGETYARCDAQNEERGQMVSLWTQQCVAQAPVAAEAVDTKGAVVGERKEATPVKVTRAMEMTWSSTASQLSPPTPTTATAETVSRSVTEMDEADAAVVACGDEDDYDGLMATVSAVDGAMPSAVSGVFFPSSTELAMMPRAPCPIGGL